MKFYIPIPVLSVRTFHHTLFLLLSSFCPCFSLMPPLTRHSRTTETANNTLTCHSQNQVPLETSKNKDITSKQRGKRRQTRGANQENAVAQGAHLKYHSIRPI